MTVRLEPENKGVNREEFYAVVTEKVQEPCITWEQALRVQIHSETEVLGRDQIIQLVQLAANFSPQKQDDNAAKMFNFGFIELCCERESALGRIGRKLGFDVLCIDKDVNLMRESTVQLCLDFIKAHDRVHVHASLPCTPWSQLQYLNEHLYGESFSAKLKVARRMSLQLVLRTLIIFRENKQRQGTSSFEWPKEATGWQQPLIQQLIRENLFDTVLVDGCSVGVVSKKTGDPIRKPWRFETDNPVLQQKLSKCRCPGNHRHVPCEGSETIRTGIYPDQLAKIMCKAVLDHHQRDAEEQARTLKEEQDDVMRSELIAVATQEETKAFLELSQAERNRLIEAARKVHVNSGHRSPSDLAKLLRKNNAPLSSRAAMEAVKCSSCQENKRPEPFPVSSIGQEYAPFQKISLDVKEIADRTHKYNYLVVICNATRLTRTIKIHSFPKGQHKNVVTEEILEAFEQGWEEIFGLPEILQHDSEGAFISTEFITQFSEKGVKLQPTAGEAHWQNGLVERVIQTIFSSATRIVSENQVSITRAVSLATAAHNHLELVHGFSPTQWALGRSPNWAKKMSDEREDNINLSRDGHEAFAKKMLEQIQARKIWQEEDLKRKVQRAERAKHRKDLVFVPGELVYAWRLGTNKISGSKKTGLHKGAWFGPATVLGTESKIVNDRVVPSAIIWIIISDRLWRCAPQQVRRASEREHSMHVLNQPKPWTFESITRNLAVGQYRDITKEGVPEQGEEDPVQEDMDFEDEEPQDKSAEDDDEMPPLIQQPESASVPKRSLGQDVPPPPPHRRLRQKTTPGNNLEQAAELAKECAVMTETAFFGMEHCPDKVLEISFPMIENDRAIKKFLKNSEAFVVTSLKKKRVEISLKNLNADEKELIRQAKGKEVKEFIREHVVERLKDGEHVDPSQIMRMRWVLTWKKQEDGEKKGKARLVVLGFEDPFLGKETTSSPTLNRRSKQILLQVCVQQSWRLLKGDVTAAFLQGKAAVHNKYALAPPELAEAMNLPKGERVVRLIKSVYGLTTAPIEWFQKVNEVLRKLGAEQCAADPCVWRFVKDGQLIGLVGAHVDDFLICGNQKSSDWQKFLDVLLTSFRWTPWEKDRFKQCGVLITQGDDNSIIQHQEEYLSTLTEIDIKRERTEQVNSPVTESERTQLRALLGGLQWLVTQTRVDGMIDVNLLQSQVVNATVETLLSANKVLRKLRQGPSKLYNRQIPTGETIHLVAWSDASWANRKDGKSTGGFLIGLCGDRVLHGERGHISVISWGTNKLKRVARSSMSAELQALAITEDELHLCRLAWAEFNGYDIDLNKVNETVSQVPGTVIIDAKSIYDALTSQNQPLQLVEKRTALELLAYLRNTEANGTETRWVHGGANLADGLTKLGAHPMLREFLQTSTWSLVYDPAQQAGKKRQAKGLDKLENEANEVTEDAFVKLAWNKLREVHPEFCEDSDTENRWY